MQSITVTERVQLLDFLIKHLSQFKRTKIKQILKFGSVRVNGKITTLHRHELRPGDTISFLDKNEASIERMKADFDFKFIYEDDDIIVVDKPAGLLTVATETEKEETLYFMLTDYARKKNSRGGRVFIVHRLDRDASGLIVFAKTEDAKLTLQRNWDLAVKKYYAITEGAPSKKQGTIKTFLEEDKFTRVFSTQESAPAAKAAITHYKTLRENPDYSLLEVTLETGRKNQIRVHLSEEGYPIVGDSKYGAKTDTIGRLALHSFYLSFPHPSKKETKEFTLELPYKFEKLFSTPGSSTLA